MKKGGDTHLKCLSINQNWEEKKNVLIKIHYLYLIYKLIN